jgi:predicted ribosome quality control (RQC) complex YloA/Tae2 family protein
VTPGPGPGLGAGHVAELVGELVPLTKPARVRSVDALPPRDLLLVLETPAGEIRRLRLSADPSAPRFHLQIAPVERHRGPVGPFYRKARELMEDRELMEIAQLEGDRIVRFSVGRGPTTEAALVLELTGRRANLILLEGTGTIAEALDVPAPGSRGAERLAPGRAYARPMGGGQTAGRGGRAPGGRGGETAGGSLAEHLPDPPERGGLAALAPLSWRVEAALGGLAGAERRDELRGDLEARLERRRKAAAHLVRGLEVRETEASEAERLRRDGELLLAHCTRIARGLAEVRLPEPDGAGETERRIELDPRLSARENAERFFARYKKLRRTAERLPEERGLAQAQLERLDSLLERLRGEDADVAALEEEALASGLLKPKQAAPRAREKPAPRLPYIRFEGARGSELRVGRNARDNDELTFRFTHGNDLWFHTAGSPGSHVVLVLPRGREPDPEEVLDAAHLAIHFSPLRGARKAEVHVAPCKNVRKPRRAAAGLVDVAGGKVRSIRVEPERLARLLDTRSRAEPPGPEPGA